METTILTSADIREIVQQIGLDQVMDEMIQRLELVFKQYDAQSIHIPARDGFSYTEPEMGLIEWMPVMDLGRQVTIKIVGYHPQNPIRRALPTILSTVSAYDTHTGHLSGLVDGVFLTALRTGAASAVASRYMANADSRVVGLIGCGAQAVTQLHALSRVFPIDEAWAYDINPETTQNFATRVAFLGIKVKPVGIDQLDSLVASADILTTCTSVEVGQGPVFDDKDLKPWLHINAVGSDFPGKYEVPVSILKRAVVIPDFLEQAVKEGESQQLLLEEVGPPITEIVQNPQHNHDLKNRITVFDSTGWALEDEAAIKLLLEYAAEFDLGTRIELETIPVDPHNPYEFVESNAETRIRASKVPAGFRGP
jgi:L-lysine cyclodeaminase